MVKLIALAPCGGLLPKTIGDASLREVVLPRIMSVAPFKGQEKGTSALLQDQIGLGLSAKNRSKVKDDAQVRWFDHEDWFVTADVVLDGLAAVMDQLAAWAIVALNGAGAEDVLARLVPIDLRARTFETDHTARTMLGHISVATTRTGSQIFEIMAMRSMVGTLVHELETATRGLMAC